MATIQSPWFCILSLLFSSLLFCADVSSASDFHTIKPKALISSSYVCLGSKGYNKSGEAVLQIVDRHGPCSPLGQKTPTTLQLLQQDESRASYLRSRASPRKSTLRSKDVTLPANSGRSLGIGNFIVTVGLGTPKKDYNLAFDSGSDLTWTQCKPCIISCYTQQSPIFDPSQSSSYANISCSSPDCSGLKTATRFPPRCSSSSCVYTIQYGDKSYSIGYFASETLTLNPSNIFTKFQFGCGQSNKGLFGKVDGLLGLGRDKISLVSQTSSKFAGIFSYCIPSTPSSTGYLSFGVADTHISQNTRFTPLVTNPKITTFYYLDLIGISVGAQRLTIDSSVFLNSGTIIDSGTVITRLPPAAYSALKSAFRQLTSNYPSAQPFSIFDTCYDFTGYDNVSIPKITFHFQGADLDVDDSGLMIAPSISQVCLAIAGNDAADDVAIIGNRQQQRFGVIYDVGKNRVGFTPKACN